MRRTAVTEVFEPKRAEDLNWVARVGSIFLKWNWLITILAAFIIALGFDFRTPSSRFKQIDSGLHAQDLHMGMRVDSLNARLTTQETNQARMYDLIEGLAIDVCQRRSTDAYAYQRLGCHTLLEGK